MTYSAVIGIDPGIEGAIAILHPIDGYKIYPIKFIGNKIDLYFLPIGVNRIAYIEKVWKPVPLVRLAGILEGTFLALGDRVERVAPSTWRKAILNDRLATKNDAIIFCKENYPTVNLFRTSQSRVENHNFAEALCIAEYGYRKENLG